MDVSEAKAFLLTKLNKRAQKASQRESQLGLWTIFLVKAHRPIGLRGPRRMFISPL